MPLRRGDDAEKMATGIPQPVAAPSREIPKLTQRANWAEVLFAFWLDPTCTKIPNCTEPYGLLFVPLSWPASARAGCPGRDKRSSPDLPQNGLPRLNGAPPGADLPDKEEVTRCHRGDVPSVCRRICGQDDGDAAVARPPPEPNREF